MQNEYLTSSITFSSVRLGFSCAPFIVQSCHSRTLLAGIQGEWSFRYPIKALGYDKSCAGKNLTGHCCITFVLIPLCVLSALPARRVADWRTGKIEKHRDRSLFGHFANVGISAEYLQLVSGSLKAFRYNPSIP
ncbi:MAG: hypothetical protein H8D23_35280 [Candidatus Brocadiales bacterium]|nr:hypothetical protein [Candidatus Brocadiales bacterium]